MKRVVCLIAVLVTLAALFAGCGEDHTHYFGEWKTDVAPTCEEKGIRRRECLLCEYLEVEDIPATGHTWTEADCTTPKICSICGATEGEALGHVGKLGETCERCGKTIDLVIVLPELPVETRLGEHNKSLVDNVKYRFDGNEIIFEAELTKLEAYDDWNYNGFLYRITDAEGNPIKASPVQLSGTGTGQRYPVSWSFWVYDLDLTPGTDKVWLEIKDYSGS